MPNTGFSGCHRKFPLFPKKLLYNKCNGKKKITKKENKKNTHINKFFYRDYRYKKF